MLTCSICNREDRDAIEQGFLTLASGADTDLTDALSQIANKYDCDIEELRVHALFHTAPESVSTDSLTRRVKIREADLLAEVNREYRSTLMSMGAHIKGLMKQAEEGGDKSILVSRLLTKPVADMYLGLGGEIRQNVKAMAELDRMLNGPEDSTGTGLVALAAAIKEST